jgi:hypothetical protein
LKEKALKIYRFKSNSKQIKKPLLFREGVLKFSLLYI